MAQVESNYRILQEYVQFDKIDIYRVFEELYAHEINLTFGWKWDLGFSDYMIGDVLFSLTYKECLFQYEVEAPEELRSAIHSKGIDWHDIGQAASAIAYSAACLYPESSFAAWYLKEAQVRGAGTTWTSNVN